MTHYRFGPFRLEREPLLLFIGEQPLALGPKVVETLLALVEHPGEVLAKPDLLQRVWPEGFVDEANLAQNIYVIRKTLRGHWPGEAIETIPRRGYRFAVPVTVDHPKPPAPIPSKPAARLAPPAGIFAAVTALVALAVGLAAVAHAPAAAARPHLSPQGARLYSMGRFYWNQRTSSSIAKSIRYFEAVTKSDPHDARGYAGLAVAYAIEGDYGYRPLSKQAAFDRAKMFADQALAIDADSADAHAALGLLETKEHHDTAARVEYLQAIALDPGDAPAHQWYGIALLKQGDGQAAYEQLQQAAALDPESVAAADWLSEAAYMSRHYRAAIAYAKQTLDLSPQRFDAYEVIGVASEALGDDRAAINAYQTYAQSCRVCKGEAAALLAHVYAVSHDYRDAQAELRIAQAGMASHDGVDPEDLITALVAMGRRNEALRLLAHAHDGIVAIDPRMDPVRGDKRFRQFIQRPA